MIKKGSKHPPGSQDRNVDESFERSFRKKRNKGARVYVRKACSESTYFSANRKLYEGTIKNISDGGIYVQSKDRPRVGQEVIVAGPFEEGGENVKRYGKVVWYDDNGFAIQFVSKGDMLPRR